MNWKEHISVDPHVCHGIPCIKGTRVFVSVILDNLAEGSSHQAIMDSYPGVSDEDIKAAIAYGAELARERIVALS